MSVIADFCTSWKTAGILPPIITGQEVKFPRSPYTLDLSDLISFFAISRDRIEILKGFLNFRALLHSMEIVSGFQWVDGSFMENVELTHKRSPKDLDVVTFFNLPEGCDNQKSFFEKTIHRLNNKEIKQKFKVDSYLIETSKNNPNDLVKSGAYWYSVWGHTRSGLWKGFLEVDLNPASDAKALEELVVLEKRGSYDK